MIVARICVMAVLLALPVCAQARAVAHVYRHRDAEPQRKRQITKRTKSMKDTKAA